MQWPIPDFLNRPLIFLPAGHRRKAAPGFTSARPDLRLKSGYIAGTLMCGLKDVMDRENCVL